MAFDFDGDGDYIAYGDQTPYEPSSNMSFSIWLSADSWVTNRGVFNKLGSFLGGIDGYSIYATAGAGGVFVVNMADATASAVYYVSSLLWATATWTHIFAVYDSSLGVGARWALWRNGVAETLLVNAEGAPTPSNSTAALDIGRRPPSEPTTEGWDGQIAEAAIWNVSLGAAQASQLNAKMSPLSISPNDLVFYDPLIRDPFDRINGFAGTITGNAATFAHPPMYYPADIFSGVSGRRRGSGTLVGPGIF